MVKKGKGQNACFNQQYRMTLQFFTFQRVNTVIEDYMDFKGKNATFIEDYNTSEK